MSDSLWPHGLQHTRLPCLPLSPRVCSNSCPLSWWCYPTISFSAALFFFLPSIFLSIWSFSNELALCTGWPKYWSYLEKPWIRFTPENWFCLLLLSWISSYSSETKEKLHSLEYTILNCSLFWIYAYCFEFVTFEEGGKLKVLFEPCYVWGKY